MSLQLLAKQMEAKGRKGDSMLVHMTPGEVAGLQKLAESAGGSLSVNPDTGLVEANFLKRMLPALAGFGLSMVPGIGPLMAAGIVGGGTALATGDAKKGLMAGLGAYGGAGIGSGLTAAGAPATAVAPTATTAVAPTAATTVAPTAATTVAPTAATTVAPTTTAAVAPTATTAVAPTATTAVAPTAASTTASTTTTPLTTSENFAQAGRGIEALGEKAGRDAFASKVGMSDIVMATAPVVTDDRKQAEAPVDDEMYYYDYDPGRTYAESTPRASSAEEEYFDSDSGYSPVKKIRASNYLAAKGGLLSLATGGEAVAAPNYAVTGASKAGLDYLMGETGASKAALDYLMGGASSADSQGQGVAKAPTGGKVSFASDSEMYAFDPTTGEFLLNPKYEDPEVKAARLAAEARARAAAAAARESSGGDRNYDPFPNDNRGSNPDFARVNPDGSYDYTGVNPAFGPTHRDYGDGDYDSFHSERNDSLSAESVASALSEAGYSDTGGYSDSPADTSDFASGGLMGLAKGGMKSGGFVVPADVVSMIGEGNTDAGYSRIKSMVPGATAIKGNDGGQADTVKTHIEGRQPARVAHGEMYIPPETVKRMGGAKKLYAMMDRVREQATGSKKQIKPVSLKRAMA